MTDHALEYGIDIGLETLRRMAKVSHYNRWIAQKIAPYIGNRILEVGGGIGNIAEHFLDREQLVVLDIQPEAVAVLNRRYVPYHHIHPTLGDIVDPETVARLNDREFDTAMCTNVLEHIEDDQQALKHMAQLVRPGGYVVLFVPAGAYMYGTLDQALGHYRRYDAAALRTLFERAALRVERLEYCNLLGIAGWWMNSRVLKRHILPEGHLKVFNALAPMVLGAEDLLSRAIPLPIGQSLLCIARKG
jgi:ubiquinone/menaquinone biosynthesis C-methylase UbiE